MIEDAISRLAKAVEVSTQNDAVAEIIRERDVARKQLADMLRDRDWYKERLRVYTEDLDGAIRRNAALRGVITKLKRRT